MKVESNSSPDFHGKSWRLSTQKRGPQSQSGQGMPTDAAVSAVAALHVSCTMTTGWNHALGSLDTLPAQIGCRMLKERTCAVVTLQGNLKKYLGARKLWAQNAWKFCVATRRGECVHALRVCVCARARSCACTVALSSRPLVALPSVALSPVEPARMCACACARVCLKIPQLFVWLACFTWNS